MKNTGADIGVLLRGKAVNYAVKGQDTTGLKFGSISHAHPLSLKAEVNRFLKKVCR